MEKMPSANTFAYVASRQKPATFPEEAKPSSVLQQIQTFFETRSYRRILLIAGAGGAVFAAWYVYNKVIEGSEVYAVPSKYNMVTSEDGEVEMVPVEAKVVIHCNPRGFYTPSIATAPLQLETFLRVTGIPYEVSFCEEQTGYEPPFMTYGDKVGNDIRECIRVLSENFDTNLEREVSASRKTASHLVDVSLENQFSWSILIWRWIHDEGRSMKNIHAINALGEEVVGEVAQKVKEATRFHPIGLMDRDEFVKTINQGIHDISAALGRHKYFQGQTPGLVDCHAFAILVQMLWNMPGSPFEGQLRKYANLVDFVKRIKEKYWPDWNELIGKPKEFEDIYAATFTRSRSTSRDPKTKKRKASKSRQSDGHPPDDDMDEGSSNEQKGNPRSPSPGNSLEPKIKNNQIQTRKLESEAVNFIVKKDDHSKDPSEEPAKNGTDSSAAVTNTPAQPIGILKTGTNNINSALGKPRSGFVNTSGGQTKFSVPQLKVSEPSISKIDKPDIPSSPSQAPNKIPVTQPQNQQPNNTLQVPKQTAQDQDSMMHVHRPSVKFANVPSAESSIMSQNLVNGNELNVPTSQIPVRKNHLYPASAAELSKPTPRPQEDLQSIVSNLVGNNNNPVQQPTANTNQQKAEKYEHTVRSHITNVKPAEESVQHNRQPPVNNAQNSVTPTTPPSPPMSAQQGYQQNQGVQQQQPQQYNQNGPTNHQQQHQMFNQAIPTNPHPQLQQPFNQNGPSNQQQFNQNVPNNSPQQQQYNQNNAPNSQQHQTFNQNPPTVPQQQQFFQTTSSNSQPQVYSPPPPQNYSRPMYPNQAQGVPPMPPQQHPVQYGNPIGNIGMDMQAFPHHHQAYNMQMQGPQYPQKFQNDPYYMQQGYGYQPQPTVYHEHHPHSSSGVDQIDPATLRRWF